MQVVTPRFGALDIDENSLINFPQGLPGFERCQRFKLLHEEVPEPKVMWMQSLEEPEVVFSVIDANLLGLHYQLSLTDAESATIDFSGSEDLVLLLTLSRDGDEVKANTQSPIVLNVASRQALQKSGVRAEIVFTNE
ncbi:flagellar biosynthesis protein FliW [Chitinimonas arctica]|uniref:Flagellar assembly factor FliW n=1 Tax=Chitinimonas arctica TaxID=2594795 RepID=A0A516SJ69_9NEIS|nr:flagellar assembly protein FliW [Chitinimonas arctica]QDQ28187.1 flagellar biosynthesis protein FliW [Chitinimonas arctica]